MAYQITSKNWIETAIRAVAYLDSARAKHILDVWSELSGQDVTQMHNDDKLEKLRKDLLFVGFALIDRDLAYSVTNKYFIDYIKSGSYLSDPLEKIRERIQVAGYAYYDEEREMLKKALVENQEKLGVISISEWIKKFEAYNKTGAEDGSAHFVLQDSQANNLDKQTQALLRSTLFLYDNWLSKNVLSIFDLAYLQSHPELLSQHGRGGTYVSAAANRVYQESRVVSGKSGKGVLKLPLLKALSEYPRLGDQLITNEKIKIKSQAEPVRPSLTNWIHYYREELGIGFHDQVTRGHFLFQSENGKRLSAEERERINLILKSIEEEFPIDIDADRQTIVFPVKQTGAPTAPFGGAAQPATNPLFPRQSPVPARPVKPFQPAAPQDLPTAESVPTPSVASKPSFFDRQFRPAKNVAGDTLHFSTGHVLPGEKNAESGVAAPAAAPQSRPTVSTPPPSSFRPRGIVQDRGAALPRSPYSIRPLRMRDDDEVAS